MKKVYVVLTLCVFFTAAEAWAQGMNPFARLLPREEKNVEEASKKTPETPEATALPADQ